MKSLITILSILYLPISIWALIPSGAMPTADTPPPQSVFEPQPLISYKVASHSNISPNNSLVPISNKPKTIPKHTMSVSQHKKLTFGFTHRLPRKAISNTSTSQPIKPDINGKLLNHPNPTQFNKEGTTIAYYLTQDMDISLHIFDAVGNQLLKKDFEAGKNGGSGTNYNEITLTSADFGIELPAGVYFYFISYQGNKLAQSKMAVLP